MDYQLRASSVRLGGPLLGGHRDRADRLLVHAHAQRDSGPNRHGSQAAAVLDDDVGVRRHGVALVIDGDGVRRRVPRLHDTGAWNRRSRRPDAADELLIDVEVDIDVRPGRQLGEFARYGVNLDPGVFQHVEGFPGNRGGALIREGDGIIGGIDRRDWTASAIAEVWPFGLQVEGCLAIHGEPQVDNRPRGDVGEIAWFVVDLDVGVRPYREGLSGYLGRRLVIDGDGVFLAIDRFDTDMVIPWSDDVDAADGLLIDAQVQGVEPRPWRNISQFPRFAVDGDGGIRRHVVDPVIARAAGNRDGIIDRVHGLHLVEIARTRR